MNLLELESQRLRIRSFCEADLEPIHQILNDASDQDEQAEHAVSLAERRAWLDWQIASYEWHVKLHQPPFGDRAVVLKSSSELVGVVGFVPLFNAFGQIPELRCGRPADALYSAEFGLFWTIAPFRQGQGYATEAAQAMIDHAFHQLNLRRILACTEYDNLASQGVMRKLGMTILHNPLPDPTWLQIVGLLEHPAAGQR